MLFFFQQTCNSERVAVALYYLCIDTNIENTRVRKTLHTRKHHQDEFVGFGLKKSLAVGSKFPLKINLLRRYLHLREVDDVSGKGLPLTRDFLAQF